MAESGDPYLWITYFILSSILKPFTFGVIISSAIVIVLLFLSALISGSEIAFFSFNPSQLKKIKAEESSLNNLIIKLLERPKKLLATILITNNFINVSIVILSAYITNQMFDFSQYWWLGFLVQVIIITSLLLLFGEIMPKIYANQHAIAFATLMVRPLNVLIRLFHPMSSLLINSTNLIEKRISGKGHQISMSELSDAIDITSRETNEPEDEKNILKGIVKFGDIEVKEIMKSRIDIVAVENNTNFEDLLKIIRESGYSRMPVYKDNFDNVLGILYIKDLLPHINKKDNFNWKALLRKAFFIPENKKINDLLNEIQEKKKHMAIVVDEYGGTSGIVTLEDILEEIVGDISDEFDAQNGDFVFTKLSENSYVFEGKTTINDFYKIIRMNEDVFAEVRGESDTLAGLILELEGSFPQKNDLINYKNFIFEVQILEKRRIKRLKVTIN